MILSTIHLNFIAVPDLAGFFVQKLALHSLDLVLEVSVVDDALLNQLDRGKNGGVIAVK